MLAVCVAVHGEWLQRHHLTINTRMQRAGLSKGEQRVQALVLLWVVSSFQGQALSSQDFAAIGQCAAVAISSIIPRIEYQQVFLMYLVVQSMDFH